MSDNNSFYADWNKSDGLEFEWLHDSSALWGYLPGFYYCRPQGDDGKTWMFCFNEFPDFLECNLCTDEPKTDRYFTSFNASSIYDAKRQSEALIKRHLAESAEQ